MVECAVLTCLLLLACAPQKDPTETPDGPVGDTDPETTTTTDTATSTGDCGTGEIWDDGGCVPEACGRGTWGTLSRAEDAAWVDGSAPEGGDGSRDFPVQTIESGLATRKQFVFVAAGTYVENVVVGGGVELGGRCAELVTIDAGEDAVGVEAVGEADVHGFTVRSAAEVGVAVRDGGDLTLAGTVVEDSTGVGILVDGRDAVLSAFEVTVQGTDADPDRGGGIGVSVQSGAVASMTSVVLDGNQQYGIYVRGFPSVAVLEKVTVRGTRPYEDGSYGRGVSAEAGGVVTGTELTVDGNTEAGLWSSGDGSAITVTESMVTGTRSAARYGVAMGVVGFDRGILDFSGTISGTAGPGAVAQSSGSVSIHDEAVIEDSQFASLVVWDATATLRGVTLDGVVAQASDTLTLGGGAAVYLQSAEGVSALTLDEVTVSGVLEGVYLMGPGAYLVQNSTLSGPRRGYGVYAAGGVSPWDGTTGLRILADTVKDWEVGVLLEASSATVTDAVWFGNEVDVVQTGCSDAVPPIDGGGDLGVSVLCSDAVWPSFLPVWIPLG